MAMAALSQPAKPPTLPKKRFCLHRLRVQSILYRMRIRPLLSLLETSYQPRTSGKYAHKQACDACGKSVNENDFVSDTEASGGSDGPGFFLCSRPGCVRKRESLDLHKRKQLYAAQRAKNDSAEAARPKHDQSKEVQQFAELSKTHPIGTRVRADTGSIQGAEGVIVGYNGAKIVVNYEQGVGRLSTFPRNVSVV